MGLRMGQLPFDNVKVNVVGWAVKDKSLLEGSTEGLDIYTRGPGRHSAVRPFVRPFLPPGR